PCVALSLLPLRRRRSPTLFPYTTLFRSHRLFLAAAPQEPAGAQAEDRPGLHRRPARRRGRCRHYPGHYRPGPQPGAGRGGRGHRIARPGGPAGPLRLRPGAGLLVRPTAAGRGAGLAGPAAAPPAGGKPHGPNLGRRMQRLRAEAAPTGYSAMPSPLTRRTRRVTAASNTPARGSTRVKCALARVMAVYSSSLVSTGLRASGSTSAVCSNSEPWDLCTVIAYTVSTAVRRLGSTKRTPPEPSLRGKATRSRGAPSLPGSIRAMPMSPFISPSP